METTARLDGLEAGGGCASKYAAGRLEELLAGFAPAAPENLLVGLSPADDAAVYRLDDERALVFTTDFFPPMVDDPALFGAVAAVNALNDVFAMGGKPLLALSIAAFPEELPLEDVRAVFDAAAAKVAEAGAVLAGGHTIRDQEPKYGLAVVGVAAPDRLLRKGGAQPGDLLILTKPLGTGLLVSGHRQGKTSSADLALAVDQMRTLNRHASELLVAHGIRAATDVTGFGLLGHGLEMARASGTTFVFDASRLPALDGALDLARAGVETGGAAHNRRFVAPSLSVGSNVSPELVTLAHDPQTSGGLLAAIPCDAVKDLHGELGEAGLEHWAVGRVEAGPASVGLT